MKKALLLCALPLHMNRDFGSGYSFPVLIEEASVK
jgi:hypothetical protein